MPRKQVKADQLDGAKWVYWPPSAPPTLAAIEDDDRVLDRDEADDTFHIGQTYEDVAATTLVCRICRGREFNAGAGDYYTALRCPTCGWELCIHEG